MIHREADSEAALEICSTSGASLFGVCGGEFARAAHREFPQGTLLCKRGPNGLRDLGYPYNFGYLR